MYPVINGKIVKTAVVNGKRRKLRCNCTYPGKVYAYYDDRKKYGRTFGPEKGRVDFPKGNNVACDVCGYFPWVIL